MGRPKGSRNKPGHRAGGFRANSGRNFKDSAVGVNRKNSAAARSTATGGATEADMAAAQEAAATVAQDAATAAAAAAAAEESAAATAASVAAALVEGTLDTEEVPEDPDALANAILDHSSELPPLPGLPTDVVEEHEVPTVAAGAGAAELEGSSSSSSQRRGQKRTHDDVNTITATASSSPSAQQQPRITAEQQWLQMYAQLVQYSNTHSGSTHVKLTPQTRSLYHWCHNQCTAYRKLQAGKSSTLTLERIGKLQQIGFDLVERTGGGKGSNSTKWEAKFELLQRYKEEHGGDCNVPYNYEDGPFAKWCERQRYWYRILRKEGENKSQMTEERARRLEEIGLVGGGDEPGVALAASASANANSSAGGGATNNTTSLNKHTAKWEQNFAALLEYKRVHGDCLVRYNYERNPKLGRWVDRQRYWYRLMKEGVKKSQMTEERAKRLESVGFVWTVRGWNGYDGYGGDRTTFAEGGSTGDGQEEITAAAAEEQEGSSGGGVAIASSSSPPPSRIQTKWETRLQELLEYKVRVGNLKVPHNYPDNPPLANWLEKQKNELRLKSEGKPSQMTDEREEKLRLIGVTFRARGAVWSERLEALRAYKDQHGHCRVPYAYPENPQLAKWVSKQRSEMKARLAGKKSQLTEERIARLQELDFWGTTAAVSAAAASAATSNGGDDIVDPAPI